MLLTRFQLPHCRVSTHSRLKAAGIVELLLGENTEVSTHSRLKAAGRIVYEIFPGIEQFQHTAA